MFEIGQKVKIKDADGLIGYIVGIEIDPLGEYEVNWEAKHSVTYTIRRYAPFLMNGYSDLARSENEIEPI